MAISAQDALLTILGCCERLTPETIPLDDALGRVLADRVASTIDVPGFDNSAMDGFAVRFADTVGATADDPSRLAVIGESRAGSPASVAVDPGTAIRISTGAAMPAGADAVVRVEDTAADGVAVAVLTEVGAGRDVRRAGEDVRVGAGVLRAGTVLGPAELGVLATIGAAQVQCVRRPRVRLITTGGELVQPGGRLGPGAIYDSNTHSISAQIRQAGGELISLATVDDDPAATVDAIRDALDADLLIVCGGISVGSHDHVKHAFAELGIAERFWKVALRPGAPTWFGLNGGAPVFGLPGNPVSAMVTFHLFARPALLALAGAAHTDRRTVAIMDEPYEKQRGRMHAVRCALTIAADGWHARPTKEQGSHVLTSMLGADALALIEADRGSVQPGETVSVELLT